MKTIDLPICRKNICGIDIEKASGKSGIDIDEENKIISIRITNDPAPDVNAINIRIAKVNNLFCGDEWLWWEREVDRIDTFKQEPVLEKYPTIFIQNPDICFWKFTQLNTYGTDRCGYTRDPSHGCMYHRYEAGYEGIGEFGYVFGQQVPRNTIVPGQELVLYIGLHNGEVYEVDQDWWCTCCFTGGQVTQVIGEYATTDVRYIVRIEGEEVYCVSTDFVEYAVGDWVFITKNSNPDGSGIDNGSCGEIDRTDSCKAGCSETEDTNDQLLFMEITKLINKTRALAGAGSVTVNKKLNEASAFHTKDMADKCFVNLKGSDNKTTSDRVVVFGYVIPGDTDYYVEEIVDFSETESAEDIYNSWLDNPTYYDIITNTEAEEIGFAITQNSGCSEINDYYEGLIHPDPKKGKFFSLIIGMKKNKEEEETTIQKIAYMILPLKVGSDGA